MEVRAFHRKNAWPAPRRKRPEGFEIDKGTESGIGDASLVGNHLLWRKDTGITSVYLGPKLVATWGDQLSADLGIDFPMSLENTALQLVPDFRLRAGMVLRF